MSTKAKPKVRPIASAKSSVLCFEEFAERLHKLIGDSGRIFTLSYPDSFNMEVQRLLFHIEGEHGFSSILTRLCGTATDYWPELACTNPKLLRKLGLVLEPDTQNGDTATLTFQRGKCRKRIFKLRVVRLAGKHSKQKGPWSLTAKQIQ